MSTQIDRLKQDIDEVDALLLDTEPSLAISVSAMLEKALVLACASELEAITTNVLLDYFSEAFGGDGRPVNFVESKALKRQYHALFDWDAKNANKFFSHFGAEFKQSVRAQISADHDLQVAEMAFLRLGSLRNVLVHSDLAARTLELTADEILELYIPARAFTDALPALLRN